MRRPKSDDWTCLLILEGGYLGVWESPTGRFFAARTGIPQSTGYTRLHEALKEAAMLEAYRRDPKVGLNSAAARTVLWGTQSTLAYHHAPRRVQLALELALTTLNPVRATYARLRGGGGR